MKKLIFKVDKKRPIKEKISLNNHLVWMKNFNTEFSITKPGDKILKTISTLNTE